MLGRHAGQHHRHPAPEDGVIADFTVTEKMLQHFIEKVHGNRLIRPSPRVLVCVPYGSTQVERRAIRNPPRVPARAGAADRGGPWRPPSAPACRWHEARGSMVLDVGGGTSEVAVISLNGIVYAPQCASAATASTRPSSTTCRRNYGILMGEATAERIKIEIGSAYPGQQVRGDLGEGPQPLEGVPRSFTLNSNEILESLAEPLQGIVGAVKAALEQTPPELGSDVAERGIVLTGGGALLRDIDKLAHGGDGPAGGRRRGPASPAWRAAAARCWN